MLCHIYHGEKEPLLSLAGSVRGVIMPMVHLDHVGESEVLIGTHGYIRDPSGRWWREGRRLHEHLQPLRKAVIKVQREPVAPGDGLLATFPIDFQLATEGQQQGV